MGCACNVASDKIVVRVLPCWLSVVHQILHLWHRETDKMFREKKKEGLILPPASLDTNANDGIEWVFAQTANDSFWSCHILQLWQGLRASVDMGQILIWVTNKFYQEFLDNYFDRVKFGSSDSDRFAIHISRFVTLLPVSHKSRVITFSWQVVTLGRGVYREGFGSSLLPFWLGGGK